MAEADPRAITVAIGVATLTTWPWALHPTQTLGSPAMEADNHLAALWIAAQGWWGRAGPWVVPPTEPYRPPQDLLHVAPTALASLVDPSFAWGLCAWLDAGAGALGGWALARVCGASRGGAGVAAVVLGASAPLGGALVFGLSEGWTAGWLALGIAGTVAAAREPTARRVALAALPLALYLLSGWYAAAFAALVAPIVVPWAVARGEGPRGRRVGAVLAAWGLAGLPALLPLAVFVRSGEAAGLAGRGHMGGAPADWMHGGLGGADLLAMVLPGIPDVALARTAYLGVVALGLAVVGLVASLRGRRDAAAGGLALAAGWLILLALGRTVGVAGVPVGPGPAEALTTLLPPLGGLLHWSRAAGAALVFVAPLAALGADALFGARPRAMWLVAGLVAADALALSDAPWPRPAYDPRPPRSLAAVPGEGALLALPFDHAARRWPAEAQRPWQRWLPRLARPISEASEGPDGWASDPTAAWANRECAGGRDPRDVRFPVPPAPLTAPDAATIAGSVARYRAAGVDAVLVLRPRAATPVRCVAFLTTALGPPTGHDDTVTWWALPAR